MKYRTAGMVAAVSLFAAQLSTTRVADACGIKLAVKGPAVRKMVPRTSNPSDVLLLGDPPRRLERDLESAGHRVETAPNPGSASRTNYAVVITDPEHEQGARQKFPESAIVVRSGNVVADVRGVEREVSRKPLRADEQRPVVAARQPRTPIAGGPAQKPAPKVVSTMEPKEEEPAPAPAPPQPAPTPAPAPAPTPPVVAPKEQPKPAPVASTMSEVEVYFARGKDVTSTTQLAKAVKWLKANPDVKVVVEGHADPSGNPDSNMKLSQQRADWARDYLVSHGIDALRIEVSAFGDTRLKYDSADGRNRRVLIIKN